jgi:hydroxymethylglutaryl-CoA lyase
MRERVRIVEVGPRDGLQNEATILPAERKIALIEALAGCGFQRVEATSFVSPKWVPQLADAEDVMRGLRRQDGVGYPVLVPNVQGFERAVAVGAQEVAVFTAASEAFSQKNTNASVGASLERFAAIFERAQQANIPVRGYISCVLGCPYQGQVPIKDVLLVARALFAAGCYEISLGDTIGVGTPKKTAALIRALSDEIPIANLAGHFHDTYGQAIANVYASLELGVRVFDSAVAGLGGCPYAKGATGNVASEDLVYLLHESGFETGVDIMRLAELGQSISAELGRQTASKVGRALLASRQS